MDVRRYKSHIVRILPFLVMAVFCIQIISQINVAAFFPVKNVRVYGVVHADQSEIKNIITPIVKKGFFGVDIDVVRSDLAQLPWVSDIFVRRQWPNQIDIALYEKQAVARWNGEGLLSAAGSLFMPPKHTYPDNIPDFIGPEGAHINMLQYYRAINRILLPLHAKISYLEYTPYATWKVRMDNGVLLQIGNREPLTRLHRFVKVYPKIIGTHVHDVDYVDLRYSNGVAVRWKDPGRKV